MSARNDGGPAHPQGKQYTNGMQSVDFGAHGGMTLRDYFAAHVDLEPYNVWATVRHGLDRNPTTQELAEFIAMIRMTEADAMLAARAKATGEQP